MKRLRIFIFVFCVALSIPLAYFVLRTHWSLEQEEIAELRYFAVTLFDQMEEELALLVLEEEARPIDEYKYNYVPLDQIEGSMDVSRSPLSRHPKQSYILGYLQNNPDGSFQTPLVESKDSIPPEQIEAVTQLERMNHLFNLKRTIAPEGVESKPAEVLTKRESEEVATFAGKYLDLARSKKSRMHLGREEKRVKQITPGLAFNLAQRNDETVLREMQQRAKAADDKDVTSRLRGSGARAPAKEKGAVLEDRYWAAPAPARAQSQSPDIQKFQVEVDPLQSVSINGRHIFIFRRIVINSQIYRQGFVIVVGEFLDHLVDEYFGRQPMARFTNLRLSVQDQGQEAAVVQAGTVVKHAKFSLDRSFPRPFSFLRATLRCEHIPRSVGRTTLNIMLVVLGFIILIGLFTIYQSARAVVALSERRSRFVSSVTHELKTPLTNIRMYIEMLEQGIARDHMREQEYFRILGSESSRLSRLINNVLEFSKLEKKQRHLNLQKGTFKEVIQEVKQAMEEKLRQEGFALKVEGQLARTFSYDREAMIQILINLVDNSMKFGKSSSRKEINLRIWHGDDAVEISVSDTGPGIPHYALSKVFEDFYRVDSELTRTTGGTGIGLALVRKLVTAMDGTVAAKNNEGPGCTITITLPA